MSAMFSTWSEVYLHMKACKNPVLPRDPLIKAVLRGMGMYSVMEVVIRYPGIKQDCTGITAATQGTVAEGGMNSETLVQELCYGLRSLH